VLAGQRADHQATTNEALHSEKCSGMPIRCNSDWCAARQRSQMRARWSYGESREREEEEEVSVWCH
jgi:hypothetical protein